MVVLFVGFGFGFVKETDTTVTAALTEYSFMINFPCVQVFFKLW